MAKKSIKRLYSLDKATIDKLEYLAKALNVSASEAVRLAVAELARIVMTKENAQ